MRALPKEQRADLHERFAAWLEYASPELGEIIGYHLEQAYRFRAELGPVDERTQELARRAATLLAAAGQRASARADIPATINLLERAVRLLPDQDTDAVALYPDLAAALAEGGDFERAEGLYRTAQELGDPPTALLARLRGVWLDVMLGAPQAVSVASIEATIAEAERLGEQAIVAEALWRLGVVSTWLGNSERGEQLLLSSLEHAESIGNRQLQSEVVFWIGLRLLWGPTPVDDALRECERLSQAVALEQLARTELLVVQGALLALRGEFAEGRQLAAEGRRGLLELGQRSSTQGSPSRSPSSSCSPVTLQPPRVFWVKLVLSSLPPESVASSLPSPGS